jgi:hypothetical protein
VYFSNFGGADSLDYIGSVNIDNSNPQKLVALADLNGTIPYFLVKHLATNGATVYAAVYGGPCRDRRFTRSAVQLARRTY